MQKKMTLFLVAQSLIGLSLCCAPGALGSSGEGSATPDKKVMQNDIHDFAETLKRMHRTSGELYGEVNRRETIVIGPDVTDEAVMDPWSSVQPGLFPSGFASGFQDTRPGPLLPPRKRFLDLSMSQMDQIMPLFTSDLQQINKDLSTVQSKGEIEAQLLTAGDAQKRINSDYQKLQTLTKTPPYDNKAISTAAKDVHDETSELNEIRHRLLKLLDRDL